MRKTNHYYRSLIGAFLFVYLLAMFFSTFLVKENYEREYKEYVFHIEDNKNMSIVKNKM